MAAIDGLSRHPDWRLQVAKVPAIITCTEVMAKEHRALVIAFMRGMINVGHWEKKTKEKLPEVSSLRLG